MPHFRDISVKIFAAGTVFSGNLSLGAAASEPRPSVAGASDPPPSDAAVSRAPGKASTPAARKDSLSRRLRRPGTPEALGGIGPRLQRRATPREERLPISLPRHAQKPFRDRCFCGAPHGKPQGCGENRCVSVRSLLDRSSLPWLASAASLSAVSRQMCRWPRRAPVGMLLQ